MQLTVAMFGRVLLEISLSGPPPEVESGKSFESGSTVLAEVNHGQTDEVSFGYETKRGR